MIMCEWLRTYTYVWVAAYLHVFVSMQGKNVGQQSNVQVTIVKPGVLINVKCRFVMSLNCLCYTRKLDQYSLLRLIILGLFAAFSRQINDFTTSLLFLCTWFVTHISVLSQYISSKHVFLLLSQGIEIFDVMLAF